MATSTRVTTAYVDVLYTPSNAEVRANQMAQEVVFTPSDANVRVRSLTIETLMAAPAATVAFTDTTRVTFIVSGVSYANAIGRTPLVVSAEWQRIGGTAPFTYDWQMSGITGEAGVVSVGTASFITMSYTNTGASRGIRSASAMVSDANICHISATFNIFIKAEQTPTPYDGPFQGESQDRKRTWP